MADYKTTDTELGSIANAIRTKGGTTASLAYPSDFISAINAIQVDDGSSGTISLQSKTVTSSTTTFTVSADNNYDGLSQVTVNAYKVQTKTATSSTATQTITPDSSYNGLSQITINPYILESKTVTSSTVKQTITPDRNVDGFSTVIINPYKLQPKAVTPSTVTQTIIPDSNFDGLSQVIVNAVNNGGNWGWGDIQLQAKTATSSTATQTITPDSYYGGLSQVTIDPITIGTAGTPVVTKGSVSNHQISITPTVTNSTGYITGGTISGTAITVSAGELVSGTMTVTTNSTYDITNYASMVVNVAGSGGVSNIVMGTFTTGSTANTTGSVTIPYTGTGYPIALFVYVVGGPYNNGTGGNTTWYNSVTRYDCGWYAMVKSRATTTPTYGTSGADNYGTVAIIYKNSTSNSASYTRTSSMTANAYSSSDAAASTVMCRFKGNNKTLSYYIGNATSSTIGFPKSTEMQYIVIYSS